MKTVKHTSIGAIITMLLLFSVGCGSVSAPPVDLPAPITGRVDVSSPDGDGNVTVTGSEGAVTGGTTVLVVNEDAEVAWIILDMLVKTAHAQTLPSICSETGHACAVAGDDGSFQLVIAAEVGDTLTIGLIDENGDWISDVITSTVPQTGTPDPDANCLGQGVTGKVVDIKIAPTSAIPVMLRQGSDSTTNELVIESGGTSTTVAVRGCHAHSLAFYQSNTGDSIAVTSEDDRILWAGRFVNGEVRDTRSFELDYEPMHIHFVDLPTQPIIAIRRSSNTIRVVKISTSEGTILSEMSLLMGSSEVSGLTRSTALDVIPMASDPIHYTGLLITDTGSNVNSYVTVFQADGPIHKNTWSRSQISASMALNAIADGMIFLINHGASEWSVNLVFIDPASNGSKTYRIHPFSTAYFYLNNDISALSSFEDPKGILSVPLTAGGTLQKIVRGTLDTHGTIGLFTDSDGNLFQKTLWDDYPFSDAQVWAAGHDIVAIDALPSENLLFGADATADAIIDGSSLVW